MNREVSVLVTVKDSQFKLRDVAASLESAGLNNTQLMPFSGIVTGSIKPTLLERLKKVPGVEAVEQSRTMYAIETEKPESPNDSSLAGKKSALYEGV